MLIKVIAIFVTSFSIGILYRVPKSSLLFGSVVGVLGWVTFNLITTRDGGVVVGCFAGSLMVSFLSEGLARQLRKPATVFLIPGFIPLVPGREAYLTMLAMVRGDYLAGLAVATQTAMMAGAIAMGIFTVATLVHTISAWQRRGEYPDAQ